MAASNPLGAVAMSAGAMAKPGNGPVINGNPSNASSAVAATEQGIDAARKANDPAYAVAGELRDLVTFFHEFLGGDKNSIDWTKFEEPKEGASKTTPSGTAYLLATLKGRKSQIDVTGTDANKKILGIIDELIKVKLGLALFPYVYFELTLI